jgi:hypothetical protein
VPPLVNFNGPAVRVFGYDRQPQGICSWSVTIREPTRPSSSTAIQELNKEAEALPRRHGLLLHADAEPVLQFVKGGQAPLLE